MGVSLPAEEYELQDSPTDAEPLLPQYQPASSSQSKHQPGPSPHERHQSAIRHSAFRRALTCMCLAVILAVPSLALAACYFGRTTLDRVKSWEQVPGDVKDWLDRVVPGKVGADHGAFLTEYVSMHSVISGKISLTVRKYWLYRSHTYRNRVSLYPEQLEGIAKLA